MPYLASPHRHRELAGFPRALCECLDSSVSLFKVRGVSPGCFSLRAGRELQSQCSTEIVDDHAAGLAAGPCTMPQSTAGKALKSGSWTVQEDKLLADWQAKYGNRCQLAPQRTQWQHSLLLAPANHTAPLAGGPRWPRRFPGGPGSSVLSAGATRSTPTCAKRNGRRKRTPNWPRSSRSMARSGLSSADTWTAGRTSRSWCVG